VNRFNEIAADLEGKPKIICPKCGSRNLTSDAGLDMGFTKMGPNWLRCLDCEVLFIKNTEEETDA
jgi:hypothetical protein